VISDFCLELLMQSTLFVTGLIDHSFSTSLYGLWTFCIADVDWAESRMVGASLVDGGIIGGARFS